MRALLMIGLLGGTFDPIHYGHLRPAHEVYERLKLDVLRVVPAFMPPHRARPIATPAQRLRMVALGVGEFPGLIADDREIRRGGVSYTVPTLESLRDEIGDEPLCFVLGADAFAGLTTWYRWRNLFELAHLVVVQRPGAPALSRDRLREWAASRLHDDPEAVSHRPAGALLFLDITPQDVSATHLRATIARGDIPSPSALPPKVWEYLRAQGLYQDANA